MNFLLVRSISFNIKNEKNSIVRVVAHQITVNHFCCIVIINLIHTTENNVTKKINVWVFFVKIKSIVTERQKYCAGTCRVISTINILFVLIIILFMMNVFFVNVFFEVSRLGLFCCS
jgi:hypothetical protein